MKRVILFVVALLTLSLSQSALAVTALTPGYYQHSNAAIVYTGTWTTSSDASAYGGTLTYTSTGGSATFYTLSSVGSFGVFYVGLTSGGSINVYVDGVSLYTVNTYNSVLTYNMYAEFPLTAGPHKIQLIGSGGFFDLIGIQLLEPSVSVAVTAVFSLPTHTPTPTLTPTLTPTTGPTPTHTPTPSPTANYGLRVTQVFGDQTYDVALKLEVTPADFVQVGFMVVITGLLITLIFVYVHRSQQ